MLLKRKKKKKIHILFSLHGNIFHLVVEKTQAFKFWALSLHKDAIDRYCTKMQL